MSIFWEGMRVIVAGRDLSKASPYSGANHSPGIETVEKSVFRPYLLVKDVGIDGHGVGDTCESIRVR